MEAKPETVITGMGIVSPIGVGADAFWNSLISCSSGIMPLHWRGDRELSTPIGGAVKDFDPSRYIRPKKNLKVMGREIQLGVAAAELACRDGRMDPGVVAPERYGVVFGADTMATELDEVVNAYRACIVDGKFCFARWGEKGDSGIVPLWMLKYFAQHAGVPHRHRAERPRPEQLAYPGRGLKSDVSSRGGGRSSSVDRPT